MSLPAGPVTRARARDWGVEIEYGEQLPSQLRWHPGHVLIRGVPPEAFWRPSDGEPELCDFSMAWVDAVKQFPDACLTFHIDDGGLSFQQQMKPADMASPVCLHAWTEATLREINSPDWI